MQATIKRSKPTHIFHLAAYGTYPSQRDFKKIFSANTLGTANLLEALNSLSYKAFVMTGSSSEYGYQSKPMLESDVPKPNSFYSATKASATLIAQSFAVIEHKPIVIARLFSIYGPWEEPGRLVPTVLVHAMHHQDIETTGNHQVRDFVYVDDVVHALLTAAKNAYKLKGEIFNIGSGEQTKIADVAKLAVAVTKSRSKITRGAYPSRPWDAKSWRANTHKTATILKWHATTSLYHGLGYMNEWLKIHESYYQ